MKLFKLGDGWPDLWGSLWNYTSFLLEYTSLFLEYTIFLLEYTIFLLTNTTYYTKAHFIAPFYILRE